MGRPERQGGPVGPDPAPPPGDAGHHPARHSARRPAARLSGGSAVRRFGCPAVWGFRWSRVSVGRDRPNAPGARTLSARAPGALLRSLAAGELLAQRGERLVGGQGAFGRRSLLAAARIGRRLAAAVSRRLGLGLAGLLDLLAGGVEAGAGLGVLPFPLLALVLVPLEPLPGLRIEALGVLVVALLVVLGRHAVERGVEVLVFERDRTLVGLLEGQADAAPVEVDVDDLDEDLVADLDDLLGDLDVALGQLGDVHQALDALLDPDERAERHQLGDPSWHDLPDLVGAGELLPGVFLCRLERQRDPLALHVDVEHLDGDLLADLDDLRWVVDVLPGQLGDVHQAVDPAEVDERAEVDDARHHALADLALLQGVEEGLADLALGLLQPGAAGQDHGVAVFFQPDDFGLQLPGG